MPEVTCPCGCRYDTFAVQSACPGCGAIHEVPEEKISFACSCGARLAVPSRLAGKTVRCAKCANPVLVPGPETPGSAPEPAPPLEPPPAVLPAPQEESLRPLALVTAAAFIVFFLVAVYTRLAVHGPLRQAVLARPSVYGPDLANWAIQSFDPPPPGGGRNRRLEVFRACAADRKLLGSFPADHPAKARLLRFFEEAIRGDLGAAELESCFDIMFETAPEAQRFVPLIPPAERKSMLDRHLAEFSGRFRSAKSTDHRIKLGVEQVHAALGSGDSIPAERCRKLLQEVLQSGVAGNFQRDTALMAWASQRLAKAEVGPLREATRAALELLRKGTSPQVPGETSRGRDYFLLLEPVLFPTPEEASAAVDVLVPQDFNSSGARPAVAAALRLLPRPAAAALFHELLPSRLSGQIYSQDEPMRILQSALQRVESGVSPELYGELLQACLPGLESTGFQEASLRLVTEIAIRQAPLRGAFAEAVAKTGPSLTYRCILFLRNLVPKEPEHEAWAMFQDVALRLLENPAAGKESNIRDIAFTWLDLGDERVRERLARSFVTLDNWPWGVGQASFRKCTAADASRLRRDFLRWTDAEAGKVTDSFWFGLMKGVADPKDIDEILRAWKERRPDLLGKVPAFLRGNPEAKAWVEAARRAGIASAPVTPNAPRGPAEADLSAQALLKDPSRFRTLMKEDVARVLAGKDVNDGQFNALLEAYIVAVPVGTDALIAISTARGLGGDGVALYRDRYLELEKDPVERIRRHQKALGATGDDWRLYVRTRRAGSDDAILTFILGDILAQAARLPAKPPQPGPRLDTFSHLLMFGGLTREILPALVRAFKAVPPQYVELRWDLYEALASVADERATTIIIENLAEQLAAGVVAAPNRTAVRVGVFRLTRLDIGMSPVSEVVEWLKKNRASLKGQLR